MKLFSIALAVVVLVGTGGVAYACGGGGGGGGCGGPSGGHGCQTDLEIIWKNPSSASPAPSFVTCTLGLTPSTLTVVAGNMAPGAVCTFSGVLANVGHEGVTLTETVSISEPHKCQKFVYSDNIPHTPARQLSAGATYSFQGTISLSSSAGNTCQGAMATIAVTITGTESSGCGYYTYAIPQSAGPLGGCD